MATSRKTKKSSPKASYKNLQEFFSAAPESMVVRESIGSFHFMIDTTSGALLH